MRKIRMVILIGISRVVYRASFFCILLSGLSSECFAASVWKVEGGKSPVYLAGSVHFLRKGDMIPEVYQKIYRESKQVVFEVEPDRFNDAGIEMLYVKEGRCEQDKRIGDYLSPEVSLLLEDKIKARETQLSSVRRMKPWMAGMYLTVLELTRLGADPNLGVDQVYYRKAKNDAKKTGSLESAKEQITLLSSLTREEQNVFLKYTLFSLDETESEFETLIQSWQEGDESFLNEWFRAFSLEESGIMDKVLLQRNLNWIKPLEQYLHGDEPVMVIVGVGHLVGEGSVVDLLKKRGYTIFQLNRNTMK